MIEAQGAEPLPETTKIRESRRARLLKIIAHMIWPVSCPVCGTAAEIVCEPCLLSMLRREPPRCLLCGGSFPCKAHKTRTPQSGKIYPASVYGGNMKEIILALKYGGRRALGRMLGKSMSRVLPRPCADVLIPVPLHLKSARRYNQAEAIALGLGEGWGLEVLNAARWTEDVPSHAGLKAAERFSLRSSAFAFDKNISGCRAALIDDVCTTGSTLAALGEAAMSAGAYSVTAFTASHVPPLP